MNGYIDIVVIGVIAFITPFFITVSLIVFRGFSLITKIFSAVLFVFGLIGFGGYFLGRIGFTVSGLLIVLSISILFTIVSIMVIYKTLTRLGDDLSKLHEIGSDIVSASIQLDQTIGVSNVSINEIVTTTNELEQTSNSSNDMSDAIKSSADEAYQEGEDGLRFIIDVLSLIKEIDDVKGIVDRMKELYETTSLLSINAQIEAAKAAVIGKDSIEFRTAAAGFKVVAIEVREIAERASIATGEIGSTLSKVDAVRESMKKLGLILDKLVGILKSNSETAGRNNGVIRQQFSGINQVTDAIRNISTGSEQTKQASSSLRESADLIFKMNNDLVRFVVGKKTV
jgi:methyl-accepting chemotaxis protein